MRLARVLVGFLAIVAGEAMAEPYIIAHRGASGLAPENTIPAFEKAIEVGADGIEFDLQLTADGAIVVHHDYRMSPEWTRKDGRWLTADGPAIRDMSLAQIKSFDLGRLAPASKYLKRYPDYKPYDGVTVPTLTEVLDLVKAKAPPKFQLWIELKVAPADERPSSDPIALTEKTLAELKAAGVLKRTTLISFYWPALYHAQRLAPGIKTGFLSAERRWLNNVQAGRPGQSAWIAPFDVDDYARSIARTIRAAGGKVWSVYWRDLTPERLADARSQELGVGIWTIRHRSEIEPALALGIDVITTDRPDWFKPQSTAR